MVDRKSTSGKADHRDAVSREVGERTPCTLLKAFIRDRLPDVCQGERGLRSIVEGLVVASNRCLVSG